MRDVVEQASVVFDVTVFNKFNSRVMRSVA